MDMRSFGVAVVAFLGVFFIVDDNSYKEVLWFLSGLQYRL